MIPGFRSFLATANSLPATPHSAFPYSVQCRSTACRHTGSMVFRWVYKVFWLTVFVLTRGTGAHGGRHASPTGNVGFPLGLQGFPCRIACARLGGAAAGPCPQRSHFRRFACYPMVSGDSWFTVFVRFFLAGRSRAEMRILLWFLKGSGLPLFFGRDH